MAKKPRRPKKVVNDDYNPPYDTRVLQQSLSFLELPEEISDKLIAAKIETVFAVCKLNERALLHVNRFNKKNLFVLQKALRQKGLDIRPTEVTAPKQSKKGDKTSTSQSKKDDANKKSNQKNKDEEALVTKAESNSASPKAPRKMPKPTPTPVVHDKDIYIKINLNGKWGFENRNGKVMIEPAYDEVFNFKEDLCCVMNDDKYGYIDRKGNVVIPLEYDLGASFSEGYACVYRGEKCGYINKENEVIVDFEFDAGTPVEDNECRVKKDGRWGELHLDDPESVRWII
ncbi:MAG TPA: WG repeat-containing protein [Clostridia bacterium]|jgi:hypothetical protein|nr:WG repeat-containing protein [Clostridia bacterium]